MIVSLLVVAETSWGQEVEEAPPSGSPPALAAQPPNEPAPSIVSPRADHALSRSTSARVVSGLPRYAPPKVNGEETDSSADLRETEKPKNAIIRLPRYHVRDRKLPEFKNRELLTPEGKIDLAFKRHPGLKVGNIFGLNRGIAMAMYADEEAYERRLEMEELNSFTAWMDKNYPMDPQTGRRTLVGAGSETASDAGSATSAGSPAAAQK